MPLRLLVFCCTLLLATLLPSAPSAPWPTRWIATAQAQAGAAPAPPAADMASLAESLRELVSQGAFMQATPVYEAILKAAPSPAPVSPDAAIPVAAALDAAAALYFDIKEYDRAMKLREVAISTLERLPQQHGEANELQLDLRIALANDVFAWGDQPSAARHMDGVLAFASGAFGDQSVQMGRAWREICLLRFRLGTYASAREAIDAALSIHRKVLGAASIEVVADLQLSGRLHRLQGQFDQGRAALAEAAAILAKQPGPDVLLQASINLDRALLEQATGDYRTARERIEEAQTRLFSAPEMPEALLLDILAMHAGLLKDLGEFTRSEELLRTRLAMVVTRHGTGSPLRIQPLLDLAELHASLHDDARAKELYSEALLLAERLLGPSHPQVAIILNKLADVRTVLSLTERGGDTMDARAAAQAALPLRKRAATLLVKRLGKEHPQTALALASLATTYLELGQGKQAGVLAQTALAAITAARGERHPETASALLVAAQVAEQSGDMQEALALARRSVDIYSNSLGENAPDTLRAKQELARLLLRAGQRAEALELLRVVVEGESAVIEAVMGFTSQRRKLAFLSQTRRTLDLLFSLAMHAGEQPAARPTTMAVDAWIARKGLVLEAEKRYQDALFTRDDNATRGLSQQLGEQLGQVRSELSKLFLTPAPAGEEAVWRRRQTELALKKQQLESKLQDLSAQFATSQKRAGATAKSLAMALPKGAVLLELARVGLLRENGVSPVYAACIIRPGEDAPSIVNLGDAAAIDDAVQQFREAVRSTQDMLGDATLAGAGRLHRLVFASLAPKLHGAKTILLSPDGALSLIPFETLLSDDGRFAIQDFAFCYLAAGRDLLEAVHRAPKDGGAPLLMGDPDYDAAREAAREVVHKSVQNATDVAALSTPASASAVISNLRGEETLLRGVRNLSFKPLPGTRREVTDIAEVLAGDHPQLYLGPDVREAVLYERAAASGPSPRILHLATHGFFLDDLAGADALELRVQNPLLASGLVMAGANSRSPAKGHEDGLLTAEEILGLDLSATDLVVLSACRTGEGDIVSGEGVFGLRRAIALSGARRLVMSLWEVPDLETAQLMDGLYRRMAEEHLTPAAALRAAALQQMALTKRRMGAPHPLYWAAFVHLGAYE